MSGRVDASDEAAAASADAQAVARDNRAINNRYSQPQDDIGFELFPVRMSSYSRSPLMQPRCRHSDWEQCEQQRLSELEEAKARASQMERTMRWWSECTASWREKWARVRDERNECRGELRAARNALTDCDRDAALLRQANAELDARLIRLQLDGQHDSEGLTDETQTRLQADSADNQVEQPQPRRSSLAVAMQPPVDHNSSDSVTLEELRKEKQERLSLAKECTNLKTEISVLSAKCVELEAARAVAIEEIDELKQQQDGDFAKGNRKEAVVIQKLERELDEARAEIQNLKFEKGWMWQELNLLKIRLKNSRTPSESGEPI